MIIEPTQLILPHSETNRLALAKIHICWEENLIQEVNIPPTFCDEINYLLVKGGLRMASDRPEKDGMRDPLIQEHINTTTVTNTPINPKSNNLQTRDNTLPDIRNNGTHDTIKDRRMREVLSSKNSSQ